MTGRNDEGEDTLMHDDTSRISEDTLAGVKASWDGPSIRSAREQVGISIRELSSRTKINISILRALEDERFEDAPKARVYVRGFIQCIAEEIGLDPETVAGDYVPRWEAWFTENGHEYISP